MVNANINLIKQVGRVNNILKTKTGNKNFRNFGQKEKLSLNFNEDINLVLKRRILKNRDIRISKFQV